MKTTLAYDMRNLLGENWKVDEVGWSECPSYLYRLFKRSRLWVFNYWKAVGILEHSRRELVCYEEVAKELDSKLSCIGIKVVIG